MQDRHQHALKIAIQDPRLAIARHWGGNGDRRFEPLVGQRVFAGDRKILARDGAFTYTAPILRRFSKLVRMASSGGVP